MHLTVPKNVHYKCGFSDPRCMVICMANNAGTKEARAERHRQRREADRLRRQRETDTER